MRKVWFLALGLLAAAAYGAPADSIKADHYTPADLAKIADSLKAKAGAAGTASETLATYNGHHTMLAYKRVSGPGEIHRLLADIFVIVSGKATLITEGTLSDAKEESPGELRGPAVKDGNETALAAGDVVHIPAGVPHQMRVAPGDEVVYFVVKIKDTP